MLTPGERLTGTIKSFNRFSGWGFATAETGDDLFVHESHIVGEFYIATGTRVRFVVGRRDDGRFFAKSVEVLQ